MMGILVIENMIPSAKFQGFLDHEISKGKF